MTPFCIFSVDAGDNRCPLGNIAGFTLKSTLESWKLILRNQFCESGIKKSIVKCKKPGYDCASLSKKEVPWIGISCISQDQLPRGKLPGSGQVFPEKFLLKLQVVKCKR